MLIISRKKDQKIIIADNIEITILEVGKNRVRFGVNAPKEVSIHTRLKTLPILDSTTQSIVAQIEDEKPEPHALPAVAGFARR
jgi:carbon storage regulator